MSSTSAPSGRRTKPLRAEASKPATAPSNVRHLPKRKPTGPLTYAVSKGADLFPLGRKD